MRSTINHEHFRFKVGNSEGYLEDAASIRAEKARRLVPLCGDYFWSNI